MEKLIEKNYYLHKSAQEAYKSYVRAYDSHSLKQIYSVNTLNLPMVALSFGFKVPPYVDLSILCSDSTPFSSQSETSGSTFSADLDGRRHGVVHIFTQMFVHH